ncbi:MAG: LysR family transcriptional regulator [Pseudomonadota bacterium]
MLDSLTLDQLRMLVAIADAGSFTAASKRLFRAQSAVSHGIKQLEAEMGVPLFDRSLRTPKLNEAGEAVLADARTILARIDRLKAQGRAMAEGVEARLTIALSVLTPRAPLIAALRQVSDAYTQVAVTMTVDEVGKAPSRVLAGEADIAIAGRLSLGGHADQVEAFSIGQVDVVGVAAPDHPLAQVEGRLDSAQLDDHRQLTTITEHVGPYPNQLAQSTWEAADLSLRRDMLLAGLGWGTIPEHAVTDDLCVGRLIRLDLSARPQAQMRMPLFFVHRRDHPLGPVGRALLEALQASVDRAP